MKIHPDPMIVKLVNPYLPAGNITPGVYENKSLIYWRFLFALQAEYGVSAQPCGL